MMIDCFISVNELSLSKTKLTAPMKQNLTRKERLPIKELSQNKSIIIKKADMGSSVVIMNTDDYIAEGHRQLSDSKFYRKVDHDLMDEHNARVKDRVMDMFHKGEITLEAVEFWIHDNPRTAQFYLLSKIHKSLSKPQG